MNPENIRVRFAPSPTGPLHIGGLRTALFNYLYTRKHNGTFILRIEDTDQNRYVAGAEEYIIDSLKWCGIEIDEGVTAEGPHAPYRQSERKALYKPYTDQLIQSGKAYYAFDTPEELEGHRKNFEARGQVFSYDASMRKMLKNSLSLSTEETQKLLDQDTPYVIRFKIHEDTSVKMQDLIRGEVEINSTTLDDKVIFKSDGLPSYHLASVVDDHLMHISHVIRGEEWLPSLPLHILLYKAFEWEEEMPKFAHLPLILKPSGKGKLSKRDGDKEGFPVFPLEWKSADGEISRGYREDGYLPEALINILVMLGWNPGTEQEIFSLEELIQEFSLEKVGKSGARFDPEKAKWYNQQYIQQKSDEELALMFQPLLKHRNIESTDSYVSRVCSMIKERIVFIADIWEQGYYFFQKPATYDEKSIKKIWKEDTPNLLNSVIPILEKCKPFTAQNLDKEIKALIDKKEMGFGKVLNPLRLALVGSGKGAHLFDIMELLGKKETIERIHMMLEVLS